jgi:hypothetical protein
MIVFLVIYGSRVEFELIGLAVQLGAAECDAPVAPVVMPAGGCR